MVAANISATDTQQRAVRLRNLSRLLRPKSIAFVGGSQLSGAIRAARSVGFKGEMYAVNPGRDSIEGLACIDHVSNLPGGVDAALIALSPARAVETMSDLAENGVGGAVCLASGFGEAGDEGSSLQHKLVAAAGDMALLGPNCMGVLNQFDGAAVWGEDSHTCAVEGSGCAIVSQSGAFLIGITGVEQAFPLGYAISTGNQAMIGAAECIDVLLDDPRVRAIGLYVEGVENGAALGAACWKAAKRGVPVVALKGGDQAAGAEVAVSHTGAMVVERALWDAFCRRYGVSEVSSPKALVETLKLLCIAGIPAGNRVGLVSFSGGANGLVATRAPQLGLALPQPKPSTSAELRAQFPATVPIANPMDLNVPFQSKTGLSLADGEAVAKLLVLFGRDVADQFVFLVDIPREDDRRLNEIWLPCVVAMETVARDLGRPCVVAGILPEGLDPALRQRFIHAGIAPLCGFNETMEALSVAVSFANSPIGQEELPDLLPPSENRVATILDEAQGKAILSAAGVQIPEHRVCDLQDASLSAAELEFPVAVKLLDRDVQHKVKVGGVQLNLKSASAVDAALTQMKCDTARHGIHLNRVLVEQMVSDVYREIIIGISRSAAFGLSMIVGAGGTDVEANDQFSTLLLPLTENDLNLALHEQGLSRYPAVSVAVLAIARYAMRHASRVEEIEVNPLILTRDGSVIAADAVVRMVGADEKDFA